MKIAIAGAGIGGLVAALALLRRGFDVEVYEQAAVLAELGAGVQIAANGSRLLIALGLGEPIEQVACAATGKEVRLWNTGQRWPLFDLGADSIARFGAPYWMLHRGDLQKVLIDAVRKAKPEAIRLDAKCVGVRQQDDGVRLQLEDGGLVAADAVIGADGVHSRLRAQMFGAESPAFTGLLAWRGLIPINRLPADLRRPVGTNWIGPGSHVVTYPVRRGELLNFVGIVERSDWAVESWTERGSREECAADFANWHSSVRAMVDAIDVPYKWALLSRDPLPRWTDRRVVLLGDAAHPTLPFLAQGANMAIEDGLVLARCLAHSPDDVAGAFAGFEALRLERTGAVMRRSAENTRRFHNPILADPAQAAAYVDREWQPELVKTRYDWLFSYDATALPITLPNRDR